jgi:uncharacterized membrane protein YphA (DoxX/SURF4 family)
MSGHVQQPAQPKSAHDLQTVKTVARITLGFIWLYQGSVPKLFTKVPMEHEIVERSELYLISPHSTIVTIGIIEVLFGFWLVSGYRDRLACMITTLFLFVLSVLVIIEDPSLLIGPFGGLIKNVCLFACAWIVWKLSLHTDDYLTHVPSDQATPDPDSRTI